MAHRKCKSDVLGTGRAKWYVLEVRAGTEQSMSMEMDHTRRSRLPRTQNMRFFRQEIRRGIQWRQILGVRVLRTHGNNNVTGLQCWMRALPSQRIATKA